MSRAEIIEAARSFLGLTYDQNNDIIFVTDYYGRQVHRKIAYCAMYVWDILRMTNNGEYYFGGKKTASCTVLLNYYKKNHPTWVHNNINRCKAGDLIFYQFDGDKNADHIGIYESRASSASSYYYALEGNTSNKILGSQSNGGYVMRKKRHIKKVMSFVSIPYKDDAGNPYPVPVRTLQKNCKGDDVKWMQWYLNDKGYPCDIDGSFGSKTDKVFRTWQAEYYPEIFHLEVDGKCGRKSREAFMYE